MLEKFICVQVSHHKDVGEVIEEHQKNGWRLHTYQAANFAGNFVNHYLLFERIEEY